MKLIDYGIVMVLAIIGLGVGTCVLSQSEDLSVRHANCEVTSVYMTGADFGGKMLHTTLKCQDPSGSPYWILRETVEPIFEEERNEN